MNKWCLVLGVLVACVWVQNVVAGPREDEFLRELQAELDKRGNPWIAGKTSVSHLSVEEKKNLIGGLLPRDENAPRRIKSSSVKSAITRHLKNPPAEMDWRNYNGHNWMTSVKDQGSCGAGGTFGWVAAQEARTKIFWNDPYTDRKSVV